jgi:hypothetical protein
LIKNAPTSAISLWTYQSFLRLYLKWEVEKSGRNFQW